MATQVTKLTPKELSKQPERLAPGHRLCAGCGASIIVRQMLAAIDDPVVISNATGCLEVATTIYPYTAWRVPWIHNAFENSASTMAGIEAAYRSMVRQGKIPEQNIKFLALGGDGGTYDIGIQALSGAAERSADFIYVCYNNEVYSNTGTQRSGATPFAAWTTNTVDGKKEWRKDIAQIMVAHNIPYVATASLAYPTDMYNKFAKAKEITGTRYIEILAPCPPGWKFPSGYTIKVSRLSVQTGMWMLYEHEEGRTTYTAGTRRIIMGQSKKKPVEEYLELQGRFRHLFQPERDEERIKEIQGRIDNIFETLQFTHKMKEHIMDIELAPPH